MNRRVLLVGSLIVVPLLIFLALSFGKDLKCNGLLYLLQWSFVKWRRFLPLVQKDKMHR